jgi:hypothetical protein
MDLLVLIIGLILGSVLVVINRIVSKRRIGKVVFWEDADGNLKMKFVKRK